MLGLLAALAVLSALILVGIVFRPTGAQIGRRAEAIRARETEAFSVLGAFPTPEAVGSYDMVMQRSAQKGITIDWDRARRDQAASTGPQQPLPVVALRQL